MFPYSIDHKDDPDQQENLFCEIFEEIEPDKIISEKIKYGVYCKEGSNEYLAHPESFLKEGMAFPCIQEMPDELEIESYPEALNQEIPIAFEEEIEMGEIIYQQRFQKEEQSKTECIAGIIKKFFVAI